MRHWVFMFGWVVLAACDRSTPPPANGGEQEPKTPLAEVGEILAVDPPAEVPDPADPLPTDPVTPAIPVAQPVPDKPGFVISPHNGKWIDVTGVAPGELMLDPHFPAEEKKYFRVPEPTKPTPPVAPPPAPEEVSDPGAPG